MAVKRWCTDWRPLSRSYCILQHSSWYDMNRSISKGIVGSISKVNSANDCRRCRNRRRFAWCDWLSLVWLLLFSLSVLDARRRLFRCASWKVGSASVAPLVVLEENARGKVRCKIRRWYRFNVATVSSAWLVCTTLKFMNNRVSQMAVWIVDTGQAYNSRWISPSNKKMICGMPQCCNRKRCSM